MAQKYFLRDEQEIIKSHLENKPMVNSYQQRLGEPGKLREKSAMYFDLVLSKMIVISG